MFGKNRRIPRQVDASLAAAAPSTGLSSSPPKYVLTNRLICAFFCVLTLVVARGPGSRSHTEYIAKSGPSSLRGSMRRRRGEDDASSTLALVWLEDNRHGTPFRGGEATNQGPDVCGRGRRIRASV